MRVSAPRKQISTLRRGFLLLLVGLSLSALLFGQELVDEVAAVVEGEVITFSDLQWFVHYRNMQVPEEASARRDFNLNMLNQLIDQKVIAIEAEKTPFIHITNADIEARIQAYRQQFPSQEAFEKQLAEMEMNRRDLREMVRRQLAVNDFVELRFKPFVIVMPEEIRNYYENEFVPQLKKSSQPVPKLADVEESIRQILIERQTNEELDRWLQSARSKADVQILLFRTPPTGANLPPSLQKEPTQESVPYPPKPR